MDLDETLVYGETPRYYYNAIDAYEEVSDPEEWSRCLNCGLIPIIWTFANGKSTACKCGENNYDHFSIHAESIMSLYKRTGMTRDSDTTSLKHNWNHWAKTGEILFDKTKEYKENNRW